MLVIESFCNRKLHSEELKLPQQSFTQFLPVWNTIYTYFHRTCLTLWVQIEKTIWCGTIIQNRQQTIPCLMTCSFSFLTLSTAQKVCCQNCWSWCLQWRFYQDYDIYELGSSDWTLDSLEVRVIQNFWIPRSALLSSFLNVVVNFSVKSNYFICQAVFSFCGKACKGYKAPEYSAWLSMGSTWMLT